MVRKHINAIIPSRTIAPAPPSATSAAAPWIFSSTETKPEFFNADKYLS